MSQNTQPEPTHRGYNMQKFLEERSLPFMRELNAYPARPSDDEADSVLTKHFGPDDLTMLYDISRHFQLLHNRLLILLRG